MTKGEKLANDGLGDLEHLLEERVLLLVPARRVDDDDLERLGLELGDAVGGDHHRVHLGVGAVEGNARLGGVLLQLVEGARAERVRAHQARLPALLVVIIRQLEFAFF